MIIYTLSDQHRNDEGESGNPYLGLLTPLQVKHEVVTSPCSAVPSPLSQQA